LRGKKGSPFTDLVQKSVDCMRNWRRGMTRAWRKVFKKNQPSDRNGKRGGGGIRDSSVPKGAGRSSVLTDGVRERSRVKAGEYG